MKVNGLPQTTLRQISAVAPASHIRFGLDPLGASALEPQLNPQEIKTARKIARVITALVGLAILGAGAVTTIFTFPFGLIIGIPAMLFGLNVTRKGLTMPMPDELFIQQHQTSNLPYRQFKL